MIKFNKILLTSIAVIILGFKSYGGIRSNSNLGFNNPINLNLTPPSRFSNDRIHPGVVLMVSGVSFFTAGILTGRINNGVSSGYLPWYKNYGQVAAMTTGGLLFTGGIVYTLTF
tara:strand:+ start:2999 stop:3340 length:342 start_codon:yes stop_codon:yes gene_type:complete